jgi:phage recombination protein Bet
LIDFIHKAQLTGADPRLNQIYLIPHKTTNYQTGVTEYKGTVMFNYMFYLQLAQQTGQLEDWGSDVIEDAYLDITTGKKRPSWKAVAWVKRKGREKVFYECDFWEIAKLDYKSGMPSSTWKTSPKFMVRKCAIAGAFRWAFPETLGNFYIAEEMEKVIDVEISQPSVVVKKEAAPKNAAIEQKSQNDSSPIEYKEVKEHNTDETVVECAPIQEPDFVPERDIEDMRSELIDILQGFTQEWFDKNWNGKEKHVVMSTISIEKSEAKMKKAYDFVVGKFAEKSDNALLQE